METEMEIEKPKSCRCGNEPEMLHEHYLAMTLIRCSGCENSTGWHHTPLGAIYIWNTRYAGDGKASIPASVGEGQALTPAPIMGEPTPYRLRADTTPPPEGVQVTHFGTNDSLLGKTCYSPTRENPAHPHDNSVASIEKDEENCDSNTGQLDESWMSGVNYQGNIEDGNNESNHRIPKPKLITVDEMTVNLLIEENKKLRAIIAERQKLDEQPVEMTEEQWKQHATQKSLDIVESFYSILKVRDAEIAELKARLERESSGDERAAAVSVMMQGSERYLAEMNGVEILHDEGMLKFALDTLLKHYELKRRS
ncbi:hypothetical protein ACYOEI_01095 [Singulisphaera rosea]